MSKKQSEWNEFRKLHKGSGLTLKQLSKKYQEQKTTKIQPKLSCKEIGYRAEKGCIERRRKKPKITSPLKKKEPKKKLVKKVSPVYTFSKEKLIKELKRKGWKVNQEIYDLYGYDSWEPDLTSKVKNYDIYIYRTIMSKKGQVPGELKHKLTIPRNELLGEGSFFLKVIRAIRKEGINMDKSLLRAAKLEWIETEGFPDSKNLDEWDKYQREAILCDFFA